MLRARETDLMKIPVKLLLILLISTTTISSAVDTDNSKRLSIQQTKLWIPSQLIVTLSGSLLLGLVVYTGFLCFSTSIRKIHQYFLSFTNRNRRSRYSYFQWIVLIGLGLSLVFFKDAIYQAIHKLYFDIVGGRSDPIQQPSDGPDVPWFDLDENKNFSTPQPWVDKPSQGQEQSSQNDMSDDKSSEETLTQLKQEDSSPSSKLKEDFRRGFHRISDTGLFTELHNSADFYPLPMDVNGNSYANLLQRVVLIICSLRSDAFEEVIQQHEVRCSGLLRPLIAKLHYGKEPLEKYSIDGIPSNSYLPLLESSCNTENSCINQFFNDLRVNARGISSTITPTMKSCMGNSVLLWALKNHRYIAAQLSKSGLVEDENLGIMDLAYRVYLQTYQEAQKGTCNVDESQRTRSIWLTRDIIRSYPYSIIGRLGWKASAKVVNVVASDEFIEKHTFDLSQDDRVKTLSYIAVNQLYGQQPNVIQSSLGKHLEEQVMAISKLQVTNPGFKLLVQIKVEFNNLVMPHITRIEHYDSYNFQHYSSARSKAMTPRIISGLAKNLKL